MNRRLFHIAYWLFLSSCFLIHSATAFSQNVFSSEDDLKKQANKLFEEEDFTKAYPLFSQLLSLYPKDPQYNYKFGACLLFSSNDKEKAIPYIEYAAKRQKQGADKEVFFYLGKAYHLNYRFEDAIRAYTAYKGIASAKSLDKYDVNRQIEMCENGKRLLKNVTDLSVLEKKEVPESDFFRSYNLTEFNAKLILRPDDLKTALDKKKKEDNVMYLAPDRNEIYFSGYGEDGKTGRDIYMVKRSPAGDLSKPVRLPDVINTKYDEDYAFLHPNGRTLYFCSKGHNSMGGYDIFRSEWNNSTQSWGKPVNMDFAINTPDDDILFVSDEEDKSAYFSSRRESAMGMMMVYKIKLDRKPLDLAIITGTLTKNTGDKMPKATITVTKILKDEVVGVFNTNTADGSYTLNLPNGGKFMFTVESAGFKKSSELVVVPTQQEIKPLKQEIALMNEGGQDKVVIKNEFDAQVDSADLALAVQYIKSKASLEVSPAEELITSVAVEETTSTSQPINNSTTSSVTPVSNNDIIGIAYDDAKVTQKDANEARKNSDAAQQLANQKNQTSLQKNKEATELVNTAETMTNQEEKMAQIDKATQLRKEADALSKEAALSLTLSNQMDEQARAKQQQADAELKYAKDLDNSIKSGASEKKMNDLLVQKEKLDKRSDSLKTATSVSADLNKQADDKQTEASKSMAKYIDIQQDVEDLQSEAKRLRTEAEKAKNDGVKQNMISQAEEMEKEAETKKKEADTYNANAKQLQSQADSLKSNATFASSVMEQIERSSSATETASNNTTSNTTVTSTSISETKTESTSSTAEPPAIQSPYVDVFVNEMHQAEKKQKELDKEEALAVIYQQWTDSLDNQIATLNKQLTSAATEEHKKQIQYKISELTSSVEDKRQKAADSRNKVDNLKLQEALAAASTVTPETTTVSTNTVAATSTETSSTTSVSPENLQGTNNINNYYDSKLKENEKETNEYTKKSKEQELYTDWSSSLYDESLRLKKDGKGEKAYKADIESKEKQAIAMQTADKVTEIIAEHPDWVEEAKTKQQEAATASTQTTTVSETTTSVVPETSTVSTNTFTATNPVSTETVSISTTEATASSTTTESANPPVNNSTLSTTPPESVKNKDEYTHYASLKNESDWAKKNADRQNQQGNELQKVADEQYKESQRVSQQSASTTDPNEKQILKSQSGSLEKRSLKNQAKADSIKVLAKNSEAEANSKRTESELYLQSLDKSAYEEIASVTGYKPSTETTALTATTETKTESANQPTNTSSTSSVTPRESTMVVASYPVKTETVSPTTAETTSSVTKTESATQTDNTTNTSGKTEIIQPTNTETTTASSSTAKTEFTNPPINTSPATSSEMLKYYDALFDKIELTGATYSSSKPIPVNPPMPEGLVFKVQIGAFRNPIPQNLFKGIKPITAETTPLGLKRYTAGLFQKFSTAADAKKQVNELGYRDAFVVAFFNGKRISMNDALAKAKENGETIDLAVLNSSATSASSSESSTNMANATDVKSVSGLFYAVQIGVFSKPTTSTQLYNISPLNSERTDNGLIRYTTGRFTDEIKAVKAKNSIAGKGITDAFVVAYYNGKRISLASAKSMIDSQGQDVISKDKQEYSFVPSDTTTSEKSATALTTSSNKGIVFKVQVGAYREKVPIEDANKLLNISNKGIKTFNDENGLMIYTAGEFLEYESANNLKMQIINEGLSGAFIIAFKDGKKMSAADALDLIKNK
ncbi:MAG: PD40 domain-containing protein [Bacteroidetes bacterium]|nr:PD40 domain-containing protein [Bacteroidota bacterium]